MDCCKRVPSERLTFCKIIEKYKMNEILKELDKTETEIQNIWKKAISKCKGDKDNIDFKKFLLFLIDYFRLKNKHEEKYYLKEALRLPFFLQLGAADPTSITYDHFGAVGRLFKFIKKKDDGFIQRIVELFKSDWFYGTVDRTEAIKQLEANKRKGYFIVRFANSKQLCFTYQKQDGS